MSSSSINSFSLSSVFLEKVKSDFQKSPKSLDSLNLIFRNSTYDFNYIQTQVRDFLDGKTFQSYQGSINRLKPLAESYCKELASLDTVIQSDSLDMQSLQKPLQIFIDVHQKFYTVFIKECEDAFPDSRSTVLNRYPGTLKLYFTSFVNELVNISPSTYSLWEKCVESSDPKVFELFPRLAIHNLVKTPSLPIPELFSDNISKIQDLRISYKKLDDCQKNELIESLRYERDVKGSAAKDLFLNICKISSDIQFKDRVTSRGMSRVAYEEAVTAFSLLKHIHLSEWTNDANIQMRHLFLGMLKQDELLLPSDFKHHKIQDKMSSVFNNYKALMSDEREKFESLFLSGKDRAEEKNISDLIYDWDEIYFLWSDCTPVFPIHLLVKSALMLKR